MEQKQYQSLDLSALEQLDNAYYALQETESLEALLADYLREQSGVVQ